MIRLTSLPTIASTCGMTVSSVCPSYGLPGSAFAASTNWPPRDGDLHAELVRLVRLAFADALDLGRMQRIDLAPALAALLIVHTLRQEQQRAEDRLAPRRLFWVVPDVSGY